MPDSADGKDETGGATGKQNDRSPIRVIYGRFVKDKSAAWTAIFTGILTVFTFLLYKVSDRADETARTSQRAFVTFINTVGQKITDVAVKQIFDIQFFVILENGGSTPTKSALGHCSWQSWYPDLPSNFDYPDLPGGDTRPFVIGPRSTTTMPMVVPLSAFQDAQQGRKRLFVWGWTKYRDAFTGSPPHLTEFCSEVVNVRSTKPDMTDAGGDITWQMATCREHNCYDEDCPDYKERTRIK